MRSLVDFPVKPEFNYIAVAPWPEVWRDYTLDWVESVTRVETWLVDFVGYRYRDWVYASVNQDSNRACVAFRWERDQCLFLLRWAG